MHSHLRALLIATPAALLIAPAADAGPLPAAYSGTTCHAPLDANNPNIFYMRQGVGNASSVPQEVICSGPQVGVGINRVTVHLQDRTPTQGDFCCIAFIMNENGVTVANSAFKCVSSTSTFPTLLLSVSGSGYPHLHCIIPPVDQTAGPSFVASYSYDI